MATTHPLSSCPSCELGPFTRNHYFTGKLLVERDFTDEQRYYMDKLRHHHQRLHGRGVVCGLRVREHPNPGCRDRFVCIEPGSAIDCCGREIIVREEECIDLYAFDAIRALRQQAEATARTLQITVCYRECPTEEIPVLYDECGCDDTQCAPNRILESYRFDVRLIDPATTPMAELHGARLERVHTLAVARAHRVAFDAAGERVYTLTANAPAGPASLLAFSARHHALLRSTGFAATEEVMDLAVAPNGALVFVALRSTAADEAGRLQVRVLDADLTLVNTLSVPDNAGEDVRLAVAPDGRLYALNVGGSVFAWDNPAADTVAERGGPIAVGAEPRAIRVAADGGRVFVANRADASLSVIGAGDLLVTTLALPAGARPAALATAGSAGEGRLIVGDEAGGLYLFRVRPDAADPLPQAGSLTLPGEVVDVVASRGGRWVFALLRDANGRGSVQVIDAQRAETGAANALGASLATERGPRSLAIAADGRRLYAAAAGTEDEADEDVPDDEAAGGVAVIDILNERCEEILDTLVDCPECEEPDCLVLATIRDYTPGQDITNERIDNLSDRPLLPSTSRIVEVIRCLLDREEGGGGGPGETGPPGLGIDDVLATFVDCKESGSATIQVIGGVRTLVLEIPRGCDGEDGRDGENGADGADGQPGRDGQDGVGLETDLVQIRALSWIHRERLGQFLPLLRPDGTPFFDPRAQWLPLFGLVIGFSGDVQVNERPRPVAQLFEPERDPRPLTDADHVFNVLVEHPTSNQQLGLRCRCPLLGDVLPVDFDVDTTTGERITAARVRLDDPDTLAQTGRGIAWVLDQQRTQLDLLREMVRDFWVVLRGDFVLDTHGRAVDAEFTRSQLPTGDRPAGSNFGAQGGLFESWFGFNHDQPVGRLVNVNDAGADDLRLVPGIGRATIERIETERTARPFESNEDFRARLRISDAMWERMRDFITVRPREG
jgi:DNA-binding beta-propeller fold protein YncE